jgi:hypothetical protein
LWGAGTIVTVSIATVAWGWWSIRNMEYAFDNGRSLQANISGRWDWSVRGAPCTDSAHTIAFPDDGDIMTITQQQPVIDSSGRDLTVTTYDLDTVTPSRIRGAIRGENRLTDDGEPVVWELVVVDPDTYHWHRTDWPPYGLTAPIVRCGSAKGTRKPVTP